MGFDAAQLDALRAKLDGGVVKGRSQAGRQVSYIEGWHAIAEANRIFGFDRWHRETTRLDKVAEAACRIGVGTKYEKDGWRVGYIAKVRVEVFAGERAVIREGMGYGSGIDADLGAAHESAIKEAETDAMKRALMTFGNPFGLALYDKEQSEVDRGGPPLPVRETSKVPPINRAPVETDAEKAEATAIKELWDKAKTFADFNYAVDDTTERRAKLPKIAQDWFTKEYQRRADLFRERDAA